MRPFVDRANELANLKSALRNDGEEALVFVFTGNSGIGKTALRNAFVEQALIPNKIPHAVLDYDGNPDVRPIDATARSIRRQLGTYGVRTPVFDYLYARYYELSTGAKISSKNFPPELEGGVSILEKILGVGNVTQIIEGVSQLGLLEKERLQHKEWLYRARELEPFEILNILPEVLAEDLQEAMKSQNPNILRTAGVRICLLFDAYELIEESQLDDTLHRKLILLTPHLLRVVFSQSSVPWVRKYPREWYGKVRPFPALGNLSRPDVREFLKQREIPNPSLQEQLYRLTNGYPFHLELAADVCHAIEETTRWKPSVDDFQGAAQAINITEELIHRLFKHMKENEKELLELTAYPRWISAEMLNVLSSIKEDMPRIFKKFIELSIFSPHPEIPDAYVMQKEVRDYLITQRRRERFWKQRHERMSTLHREQWENTHSLRHLQEAIYHGFYENPLGTTRMFEEHFWKCMDSNRFAEAQGLLMAIPEDAMSEGVKRKIDYARAQLLSVSAPSRDALITAKNIYEKIIASETNETELAQYFFSFSDILHRLGEHARALEFAQKALDLRMKLHGEEHQNVASSYSSIGSIYSKKKLFGKALEYYEKALNILLKVYGDGHPKVASAFYDIGTVCYQKGKYSKALEYYVKALAIWLKTYGAKDPSIALSYQNISSVYSEHGEFDKALDYIQKALTIWMSVYGKEHPKVAHACNNMSIVYWQRGQFDKALEFAQKGLSILLDSYGEEHQDIAEAHNIIGLIYWRKGKYEKAFEYYNKSLITLLKLFGEKDPRVAATNCHIGTIYKELGTYEKALNYCQQALTILLETYGAEHPDVALPYFAISSIYREQGTYGAALDYGLKGHTILLMTHGEEHWGVSFSYNNIGLIYGEQAEFEKALEFCKKGLANASMMYGDEHYAVAESYFCMGSVYRKKGDFNKALENFKKALTIWFKVYGKEHPYIADTYKEIAYTLRTLKRNLEVFEKIQQSIQIYTHFHLWKDAETALETLAAWLDETKQNREAEQARVEADKIRKDLASLLDMGN